MDRQQTAGFPLLTMACQGDRRAIEMLIEFCGPRMRRVIRKLCRKSPHLDVDDVFQDVWFVLLKSNRQVLGRYQASKGDLGAYLIGIINKVVCKNQYQQRLRGKHEVHLASFPSGQDPFVDPGLEETVKDLAAVSTSSENHFLEQSLLQRQEKTCRYSQVNSRQLTRRLLDKAWSLVYGQDVPRPRQSRKGTRFQMPSNPK
jgi:DNA-directed RNA polymerase specialized sigma24 family protein